MLEIVKRNSKFMTTEKNELLPSIINLNIKDMQKHKALAY